MALESEPSSTSAMPASKQPQEKPSLVVDLHSKDGYLSRKVALTSADPIVYVGRASRSSGALLSSVDNVYIDSPIMSRQHAIFSLGDNIHPLILTDTGSTHGTSVNGNKIRALEEVPLQNNQEVAFGATVRNGHLIYDPVRFTVKYVWEARLPTSPSSLVMDERKPNVIRMPSPIDDEDSDLEEVDARRFTIREPSVVFVSASQKDQNGLDAKPSSQNDTHIDLTRGDDSVQKKVNDLPAVSEPRDGQLHHSDSEPPEVEKIVKLPNNGPTTSGTYQAPGYSSDEEDMTDFKDMSHTVKTKTPTVHHDDSQLSIKPAEPNSAGADIEEVTEQGSGVMGSPEPSWTPQILASRQASRDEEADAVIDAVEEVEPENLSSDESSSIASIDYPSDEAADSSDVDDDFNEEPDDSHSEPSQPASYTPLQPASPPDPFRLVSDNEDYDENYYGGARGLRSPSIPDMRSFSREDIGPTVNQGPREYAKRHDYDHAPFGSRDLPRDLPHSQPFAWPNIPLPWAEGSGPVVDDSSDDDVADRHPYPAQSSVDTRYHGVNSMMSQARAHSPSDIVLAKPVTSATYSQNRGSECTNFLPTPIFASTSPGNFAKGSILYQKPPYPIAGFPAPSEPEELYRYTQGPFAPREVIDLNTEVRPTPAAPLQQHIPPLPYLGGDQLVDMEVHNWSPPFSTIDDRVLPEPRVPNPRSSKVPISEIVNKIPNNGPLTTHNSTHEFSRTGNKNQSGQDIQEDLIDTDSLPRTTKRKAEKISSDETDPSIMPQLPSSSTSNTQSYRTQESHLPDAQPRDGSQTIELIRDSMVQSSTPLSAVPNILPSQSAPQSQSSTTLPTETIRQLYETASKGRGEPQRKKIKTTLKAAGSSARTSSSLKSFATGCIAGAVTVVGTLAAIIATIPMSVKDDAWNAL